MAQVLLTLPYSFSQLGMLSGIIFQIFYGLVGSWTAYLISVLYIEYRSRKEKENVSFKNHVIQVSLLQAKAKQNASKYLHLLQSKPVTNLHFTKKENSLFLNSSGLKCLMGYWVLTGKQWVWPSTVLSSFLDPSYS